MYGDNYLAHYGVPGMKWGVRREIGERSREYARMKVAGEGLVKKYNRNIAAINKRAKSLGSADAINQDSKITKMLNKRDKGFSKIAKMDQYMDRLSKDLTPKDIEQGRRQVTSLFSTRNSPLMIPFNLAESARMRKKYDGNV